MAAGQNLAIGVCEFYAEQARKAVAGWDGQNTADLLLDIIQATGESASEVLEEAMEKHKKRKE